jgi:hypothetical protein
VIGAELRFRIKRLPDQTCRNGRRFQRLLMDLGFGVFAFAVPDNCLCLVLTDFYLVQDLVPDELRCPVWHH